MAFHVRRRGNCPPLTKKRGYESSSGGWQPGGVQRYATVDCRSVGLDPPGNAVGRKHAAASNGYCRRSGQSPSCSRGLGMAPFGVEAWIWPKQTGGAQRQATVACGRVGMAPPGVEVGFPS